MLERIAAAIYEEYRTRALRYGLAVVSEVPWDALPDSQKDQYRATARAAWVVIEVPTKAMIEAGDVMIYGDDFACGINVFGNDSTEPTSEACWRQMVSSIVVDEAA